MYIQERIPNYIDTDRKGSIYNSFDEFVKSDLLKYWKAQHMDIIEIKPLGNPLSKEYGNYLKQTNRPILNNYLILINSVNIATIYDATEENINELQKLL
jgi:hypothetical protein